MPEPRLKPIPLEVARAGEADVRIRWNDGHESVYPARFLRSKCSCALCADEMSGRRIVREEDLALGVKPLKISLVGRYALHIQWSDAHDSGLFAFDYLRGLCLCKDCINRKNTQ